MARKWLDDYFGFNKQQRRGVIVLACLCMLLLLVRLSLPYFIKPPEVLIANLPLVKEKADSLENSDTIRQIKWKERVREPLFTFDPNTVTAPELSRLGLRDKTIKTFMKLRSRGFVFRKKDDLRKVYGISDRTYARLEPFIAIGADRLSHQPAPIAKRDTVMRRKTKETGLVDLNAADSAKLESLAGIGSTFAKRILKYREMLGGFSETAQLREVFGITDETYRKASPQLTVNTDLIRKISVNSADFKTVNRHPYISYEATREIFNFRRKQKLNEEDLKRIIANDSVSRKLRPYVSFE